MKKNTQSTQPVFSIDINQFTIPEEKDIPQKISELKKQKHAIVWLENNSPKVLHKWADYIYTNAENTPYLEKIDPSVHKLIIIQGNKEKADLLQFLFPEVKVVFIGDCSSYADYEVLAKLYNALYHELPEQDNMLSDEYIKTKIILSDIKIFAHHGVLPEENIIGTNYLVNVEAEVNVQKATKTDCIQDTISYAELNEIVHQEMYIPSKLIEHVAGRIFRKIKIKFPKITYLKIKITKLAAPMQGENSGATIVLEKEF